MSDQFNSVETDANLSASGCTCLDVPHWYRHAVLFCSFCMSDSSTSSDLDTSSSGRGKDIRFLGIDVSSGDIQFEGLTTRGRLAIHGRCLDSVAERSLFDAFGPGPIVKGD